MNEKITEVSVNTNQTQKKSNTIKENENLIEKRICTGTYSGTAAVGQDIQTGQYIKGTVKI